MFPWIFEMAKDLNLSVTVNILKMYFMSNLPSEGKSCKKRFVPPLAWLLFVALFRLTFSKNSSTFSDVSKSRSEWKWTIVSDFLYCRCCCWSDGKTNGRTLPSFLGMLWNFLADPSFSKLANDIKMFVSSLLPIVWAPEWC